MPRKKKPPYLRASAMLSGNWGNLCKLGNSSQTNHILRLLFSGNARSVIVAIENHIESRGFNEACCAAFEDRNNQPSFLSSFSLPLFLSLDTQSLMQNLGFSFACSTAVINLSDFK